MALTLLLTGFGPFPGAPINPTGWLIDQLVRRRHPAFMGVRRITHVFETSYEAVDRVNGPPCWRTNAPTWW